MSDLDVRLERELMKPENFPQRFKFARLRADETHGSLGKQCGMSDAAFWQWENGNNLPSPKSLGKAAKVLGVNPAWLKSGVGEMLTPRGDPGTPKLAEKLNGTTGPDGMDLTGRLKFAREKSGLTNVEVAKKVGMGISSIGFHFTEMDSPNYRKPSAEMVRKYARLFQVKELWLESGIGKVSWDGPEPIEEDRAIAQRLHDCAIRAGLESREIGEKIGLSKSIFSKHSTLVGKTSKPSDKTLIAYAKMFEVPLAWLVLGKGEPPFEMHDFDLQAFRRNIQEYCHIHELTNVDLCKKIGVHPGTFSSYITTENYARPPKPVTVGKIAKALGVNFDWLYSNVGPMDNAEAPPLPTIGGLEARSDLDPDKIIDLSEDEAKPIVVSSLADAGFVTLEPDLTEPPVVTPGPPAPMIDAPKPKMIDAPSNSIQETSVRLTALIAERDEYRGMADATQVEIDRWTAVLMSQIN